MKPEEITPGRLQLLDDEGWKDFCARHHAAAINWPQKTFEIVMDENCRRWKLGIQELIHLDKIRCQRFPDSGPREYPDTFEEYWEQTGRKEYAKALAETEITPQPGNPN